MTGAVTPALDTDTLDSDYDIVMEIFALPLSPAERQHRFAQWQQSTMDSQLQEARAEVTRLIASWFAQPHNSQVRWVSLAFAAGLEIVEGVTMTQAARVLGVSRSAISKEANHWADVLHLPRSRYMKSQVAREKYHDDKLRKHWRRMRRKRTPGKESFKHE